MVVARHTVIKVFFAAVTIYAVINIPVMRIGFFNGYFCVAAVFIAGVLSNALKLVAVPNRLYKPPVPNLAVNVVFAVIL